MHAFDTIEHDDTNMGEPCRQELVAEAFFTFGEDAARALAVHFAVSFDACREKIDRLRHRPQ